MTNAVGNSIMSPPRLVGRWRKSWTKDRRERLGNQLRACRTPTPCPKKSNHTTSCRACAMDYLRCPLHLVAPLLRRSGSEIRSIQQGNILIGIVQRVLQRQ